MSHCKLKLPSCSTTHSHLEARSYVMQPRWPLPAMRLIMETQPGTCDFYRSTAACCALTHHPEWLVERFVREVLVSFLGHCNTRLLESTLAPTMGGCQ